MKTESTLRFDCRNFQYFIIDGNTLYSAGYDYGKAHSLFLRLADTHRPNIMQTSENEIYVCWNNHEKGEKCSYEKEL